MKYKRITAMTIAALMAVSGAEAAVNEPVYERATGKITVSGTGIGADETVRMIVLKPDADYDDLKSGNKTFDESCVHIAEIRQAGNDGSYTFPVFKIKDGAPAGTYKILVTEGNAAEPVEKTVDYASIAQTLDFIKNAASAQEVKDYVKRFNADVYKLPIGEDTDYYKLSDNGQLTVLDKLRGVSYNTVEDLKNRFETAVAEYKPLYEAEALNAIKNSESAKDIAAAIEEHNRFYGIDTDDEEFKLDDNGKEAVYEKLIGETYTKPEDLQTAFRQKTVLYCIEKGPWGKIPEYISKYNDSVLKLDLSGYSADNTELLKSLVGKNFKNTSDLQKFIDNYVPGGEGGGNGGTRRGSSGNKVESKGISGILPTETAETEFSDVPSAHWAYESVNALYKKGIINGRGNGVFSPDDSVTRSEAVKMIVLAINVKNTDNNTVSFADLSEDDWEYDYVLRGVRAGIIKGKEDNTFGGNDNITRQDMCVMIYRAMLNAGYELPKGDSDFSDSEQISDYAADAINALVSGKIISGIGGGLFDPLASATRAQAAKMIYGVIK